MQAPPLILRAPLGQTFFDARFLAMVSSPRPEGPVPQRALLCVLRYARHASRGYLNKYHKSAAAGKATRIGDVFSTATQFGGMPVVPAGQRPAETMTLGRRKAFRKRFGF